MGAEHSTLLKVRCNCSIEILPCIQPSKLPNLCVPLWQFFPAGVMCCMETPQLHLWPRRLRTRTPWRHVIDFIADFGPVLRVKPWVATTVDSHFWEETCEAGSVLLFNLVTETEALACWPRPPLLRFHLFIWPGCSEIALTLWLGLSRSDARLKVQRVK